MGNDCNFYLKENQVEFKEENLNQKFIFPPPNTNTSIIPTTSSSIGDQQNILTKNTKLFPYNNSSDKIILFDKKFENYLVTKGITKYDKNILDEIPKEIIILRKTLPELVINYHNKVITEILITHFPFYEKSAVKFKNGVIYKGQWSKNCKICGLGMMYLPKDKIFLEGFFIKHSLIYGRVYINEESYYEGNLYQNTFNGYGKFIKGDSEYNGYFVNGYKNGKGSLNYNNKIIYDGEFNNDLFEGHGYIKWVNLQIEYIGEFKSSMLHGEGELTTLRGNKYIGTFQGNEFNGQGTFYWGMTRVFKGNYKDNKKHGRGIYKDTLQKVEIRGIWEYGKINGVCDIKINNINYKALYRKGSLIEIQESLSSLRNDHPTEVKISIEEEDYDPTLLFPLIQNKAQYNIKDKILYPLTHEIKSSFSSYFKKPKDSFTSVPSRSKLEAP